MNTPLYFGDMTEKELSAQLVGKRIVRADTQNSTMELSDGTVLSIQDRGDCCENWEGTLADVNLSDNVITHVELEGERQDFGLTEGSEGFTRQERNYRLVVFSAEQRVLNVHVTGQPGNGFYSQSVALIVRPPV